MSKPEEVADEIERLTERGMEAEAWCEQLRVEIERLQRESNLLRELHHSAEKEVNELRSLVQAMLDNDPTDDAADGVTILDVWRKDARRALEGK